MIAAFIETLQKHMQEGLRTVALTGESPSGEIVRAPSVFVGDLPPKKGAKGKKGAEGAEDEPSPIPAVVLIPVSGHQDGGEYVHEVALVSIVHNSEKGDVRGGEVDMAILISSIIGLLSPCAYGEPMARKYVLEPDSRGRLLPWEKMREQPRPYIQATMLSQWRFKGWQ